ncbi:hypothetical protein L6R50_21915 [Myxococcota bacterium]|nr:hypothetical protein [Myxococcota bacterium]
MASSTKQTSNVRRAKMTKRGQERKRASRGKGTTPKFPIHPDQGSKESGQS